MVLLFCSLLILARAAQWAVLVAGSNGYWNYRHQADVCHSYQVLLSHGVPASNIIVFLYNDVVNSTNNPFPGQLFNSVGANATDVYAGCKVDYSGNDNNSTNFLAVLTGNETAVKGVGSGRVLKSYFWDTVFINFVDHGAPGVLAFPNENDLLYADTLIATLKYMKAHWMFRKLVFFLEACDSGSMFDGLLPDNIDVYAVTAASDSQFSWAVYCPPDDIVHEWAMCTCLGDLFTVNWMHVFSTNNPLKLTLAELFEQVSVLTNASTPMQFGDLGFTDMPAGDFLGSHSSEYAYPLQKLKENWTPRDAKLQYLSLFHPELLEKELQEQVKISVVFETLMKVLSPEDPEHLLVSPHPVRNFKCLREAISAYQQACGAFSEFAFSYVVVLKNACEEGVTGRIMAMHLAQICYRSSNV